MMHYQDDLILNVEESNAVVQVVNSVLIVQASQPAETIRNPNITCDILVHNVLWVPDLSRHLLSVGQWNKAGGEILFGPYHTPLTLRAIHSETGEAHYFSVIKTFM
jgi:hypothetical protein